MEYLFIIGSLIVMLTLVYVAYDTIRHFDSKA
jgi:hypothetical protein